jgi:hypothetical protein
MSLLNPHTASRVLIAALAASLGIGTILDNSAQAQQTPPSSPSPTATTTRFACQLMNGQHTVMYFPESQPGQAYPWAVPTALGGGWSPERRCNEISRRLESYRPDGLVEMKTGMENGYNTVCVTTETIPTCRIVLTVPPGQDPVQTRDRIFQNLTIADSGQQTQGVNTFVGGRGNNDILGDLVNIGNATGVSRIGSPSLNLRPFLDAKDGGTGTQLQGGISTGSGRRLNPGSFR